jgi:hypothetical protein
MPPRLELTGERFGRLTVVARSHLANGAWKWTCLCDCGRSVAVNGSVLKAGNTSACASCATAASQTTHGQTGTPLYIRWRSMIDRTTRLTEWRNYGSRGITVCDRWRHSFEAFSEDMGPTFDVTLELDRIDVNGDYEPGNCRWVTRVEQQRNKRNNHLVTHAGMTLTVQEWGEKLGIKPNTIITRLRRGWSVPRALALANGWDLPEHT